MPQAGDRSLVLRAKRGDSDAFGELVERYMGYVYGYAYARLLDHSDAEDAAQDTFLRAYERLNQLREPDYFESWLMRIALSRTSQQGRWRRREEPVAEPHDVETSTSEESGQEAFERDEDTRRILDAALATLPETIRVPLVMRYLTGHSFEDIARALAVTPNAVERRVSRARARLRDYFRRLGLRDMALDALVSATLAPAAADLVGATAELADGRPPPAPRDGAGGYAAASMARTATAAAVGLAALLGSVAGLVATHPTSWAGMRRAGLAPSDADDGASRVMRVATPGAPTPRVRMLVRPGDELTGWRPLEPEKDGSLPASEGLSASGGAALSNDFGVMKPILVGAGEITVDLRIRPQLSAHRATVGLVFAGSDSGAPLLVKAADNEWAYARYGRPTLVPFRHAQDRWHSIRLVYRTWDATHDIYMDGAPVARDVPYGPGYAGRGVGGVYLASGRGGVGVPVRFADMRVSVREPGYGDHSASPATVADIDPRPPDRVALVGGRINGVALTTQQPAITVAPGQAVRGSLEILVDTAREPTANFPVILTPTWGDHAMAYRVVTPSAAAGASNLVMPVSAVAPELPGQYAIIVAGAAETEAAFVASGTNWPQEWPRWNNGTDIAGWDADRIESATRSGWTAAPWIGGDGRVRHVAIAAAAVRVTVARGPL